MVTSRPFMNASNLIEKASRSAFYLRLLNLSLRRMIPFNAPHHIRISEIDESHVKIILPYRRRNLNHIKGLHACALATLAEYTTGLSLLKSLGMEKYRIIMQQLTMDYHYQGKADAEAAFEISNEWLRSNVLDVLRTEPAALVTCEIRINDVNGNHLATGKVRWQVKLWEKVRVKV